MPRLRTGSGFLSISRPSGFGAIAAALSVVGMLFLIRSWSMGTWSQEPACRGRHDGLDGLMSAFPPLGLDSATSLGKFRLSIAPQFRPLMVGMPDYDELTGDLDSPVMYDSRTQIWRSDALVNGSPEDAAGVPVGDGGFSVSDQDFKVLPDEATIPDVDGAREIHTAIKRFQMTGPFRGIPLVEVRAGTDFAGLPLSAGEVRSKSEDGDPAGDMPGRSFFNIYVEVDLPPNPTQPLAFSGATVYNDEPLLVQNDDVQSLPPRVVYLHEGPSAVAVRFREAGDNWEKDEVLGYLTLAGHGVCFERSPSDIMELEQALFDDDGIPTATPTPTITPSPTITPTFTPTSTASVTPTASPTNTATPLPSPLYLPLLLREECWRSMDVVLVIDRSSSMQGDAIEAARVGAAAFVDSIDLKRGDQLALVTFDGEARIDLGLTADRQALDQAIASIAVTGTGTSIDEGLRLATQVLTGAGHEEGNWRLVVLMTDGRQNDGPAAALEAGAAARAAEIEVHAIGLGAEVDKDTLRHIAGSSERYYPSPTLVELDRIFRRLGRSLRCVGAPLWPDWP